jgi:4-hydroxy-4-methyl-2-oxoglutarate aldolase
MKKFAPFNLSPDELEAITPQWTGARLDDGRPYVADGILKRLLPAPLSVAWGVLMENGYRHQFEAGWQRVHANKVLCGRAATAMFMPRRTDMNAAIAAAAAQAGQVGEFTSWPIDALREGDIYVADAYGKIEWGPVMGDNLATAIYARTGRGVVINAAVRDVEGIESIEGFTCFMRGVHPTHALSTAALVGINCPVRIGSVTIVPGDVILGRSDGIVVIPPHLAETVAVRGEVIAIRDEFSMQRLRERVYRPGQIDAKWTATIQDDFMRWLGDYPRPLPAPKQMFEE